MNEPMTSSAESAPAVAVQRVVRRPHPWSQQMSNAQKLKAARKIAGQRRSLKHRHEFIEEHRATELAWHRKKSGIPLDAPKIKSGRPRTVSPNTRL